MNILQIMPEQRNMIMRVSGVFEGGDEKDKEWSCDYKIIGWALCDDVGVPTPHIEAIITDGNHVDIFINFYDLDMNTEILENGSSLIETLDYKE